MEESEEEVAEVMKKYKATVSQLSVDQVNMSEQAQLISDLEHDKQVMMHIGEGFRIRINMLKSNPTISNIKKNVKKLQFPPTGSPRQTDRVK